MPVDIHKLIAAINPDLYCDPKVKKEVKALVKEEGYLAAAEVAKPKDVYGAIDFDKMFEEPKGRKYSSILITDIKFRSIPERVTQQGGYMFKGKVEANFTGYSLNEEELKVLKEELEKDDFGDVFKAVEGVTEESLLQLQTDLDEFLDESKKEEKTGDVNPFSALFSFIKPKKKPKEEKKELPRPLKPDSAIEKVLRSQSVIEARRRCLLFYDTYKKAHNMPTF